MKHLKSLSMPVVLIALAGCGGMKQSPVEDIKSLRESGGKEMKQSSDGPKEIVREVPVPTPVYVTQDVTTIDANSVVINPDNYVRFVEGQAGSFQIRALSTLKDVKTQLVGRGLPEGAVLKPSDKEANVYVLTWTAPLGTVPVRDSLKMVSMKFSLEILEAKDAKVKKALEGLVREREVPIIVLHNQEAPSELTVGLAEQVEEGTQPSFDVIVKVPGIDDRSEKKPELHYFYDGGSLAGVSYLELDGSRHVRPDLSKKEPEYLGDSKWKFSLVFDTKVIVPQPELAQDGTPIKDAKETHVRVSFKVYSPFGTSTPELLKRVRIVKATKTEAGR